MKDRTINWSQDSYISACRFAAEKHIGQKEPDTKWSYFAHISMVSMEVMAALNYESDMDGDLAVQSAILHDTIEDTDTTYDEILSEFGKSVADGVLALTKNKTREKPDQMLESLRRIKLQPKEIWMVKVADQITNLQSPPSYWSQAKKEKYREEARLILDERRSGSRYLSNRIEEKILNYQAYI